MPSDDRTRAALDALGADRERYRSAVSAAHDQMAGYLAAHRARSKGQALSVSRELGRFATGRIDAARFGALFAHTNSLTQETAERVERLVGVLGELLAEGDELFVNAVPDGGDLRQAVDDALAQAGRVFAAVLAFQAVKTGVYRPERHGTDVARFPFARWNRSERLLGFPLVIELGGADLRAEELAQYLDGRVSIVLVVRGPSTPAPLVRLVTPGTLVVQTHDAADLDVLASHEGPAVAALMPAGAARFVHDPRAGRSMRARLTLRATPAEPPRQPLGGRSVWQQLEELALLQELERLAQGASAAPPAIAVTGAGTPGPAPASAAGSAPVASAAVASTNGSVDPAAVDDLAAWLLNQAGLRPGDGSPPEGPAQ